jgi:hypothetical protein
MKQIEGLSNSNEVRDSLPAAIAGASMDFMVQIMSYVQVENIQRIDSALATEITIHDYDEEILQAINNTAEMVRAKYNNKISITSTGNKITFSLRLN